MQAKIVDLVQALHRGGELGVQRRLCRLRLCCCEGGRALPRSGRDHIRRRRGEQEARGGKERAADQRRPAPRRRHEDM